MPGRLKTYGYINAKIRAKLSVLLTEDDYSELIRAGSAEEAVQILREKEAYADEIAEYGATGDVRAVEFALMVSEIHLLRDLLKNLLGRPAEFTENLLLRYEVENLKNALRLWFERTFRGRNIAGGSSYLYNHRIIHDISCDALVDAEGAADLPEILGGTPYGEIVAPLVSAVEAERHLFPLEIALDSYYFSRLLSSGEALPGKDRKIALRVIGMEVDLLNIDRIVRFVSFYRSEERRRWNLLLPGGRIEKELLERAYTQDNIEDALAVLLSKEYSEYRAFAKSGGGDPFTYLQGVEDILRRILYDEVERLLWGNPFTVGTILAYLFLKRKEVRSVIRVLNAKQYGLDEERIREVL
ncbi:MAG: V0D/AC39 family V-type ATPase subunit [Spirochaetaceae bacterium]